MKSYEFYCRELETLDNNTYNVAQHRTELYIWQTQTGHCSVGVRERARAHSHITDSIMIFIEMCIRLKRRTNKATENRLTVDNNHDDEKMKRNRLFSFYLYFYNQFVWAKKKLWILAFGTTIRHIRFLFHFSCCCGDTRQPSASSAFLFYTFRCVNWQWWQCA